METFLKWLATSPYATMFKVGLGTSLAWGLDHLSYFNLSPAATPVVISVVTILINSLNKYDVRYGRTH